MDYKKSQKKGISGYLFIRDNGWLKEIWIDDIEVIKTEEHHLIIFLKDRQYYLRNSEKELLKKLPENQFARVHKSYIVNLKNIESLKRTEIITTNAKIPLSPMYYKEIINIMTN